MNDATVQRLLTREPYTHVEDATMVAGPRRWAWVVSCQYNPMIGVDDWVTVEHSGRARTMQEAKAARDAAIPRVKAAWKALLGGDAG